MPHPLWEKPFGHCAALVLCKKAENKGSYLLKTEHGQPPNEQPCPNLIPGTAGGTVASASSRCRGGSRSSPWRWPVPWSRQLQDGHHLCRCWLSCAESTAPLRALARGSPAQNGTCAPSVLPAQAHAKPIWPFCHGKGSLSCRTAAHPPSAAVGPPASAASPWGSSAHGSGTSPQNAGRGVWDHSFLSLASATAIVL